ncbi:DUF4097 family beta strand repeat-containing protein [Dokdonella sp.]|mgnify:FL=1|uniref:DUF4097 family beta strand repeat-containing protein n=1 Tax=Dokdonella sp. TaxID=2291710 RepID=UPI002CEC4E31|nr:DUF4097 family beta strand repeat-containing protein [Dokdonella sp.]HPN79825.1 DUF4097 family beta strand repeat-containing protein [Dokdonella sp.]
MRSIIVLSLLFLSGSAVASDCTHQADRTFDVDRADIQSLKAVLGSSDLRLRGVSDLKRIEVRGRACASTAEALENLQIGQRRDGAQLVVQTEQKGSNSFSLFGSNYAYLDLEIRVPADLAVVVDSGSGDVDARDLASLDYEAGSGDLNVENIAQELAVEVGSGDVEGSDIGRLRVDSVSSGDLNLRKIRGDAEVGRVGSGDLTLREVTGNVRVDRVGSGDVDLHDVGGNVLVGSIGSGDVLAAGVRGDLTVESAGSGDVSHRDIGGKVNVPESD